MSGIDLAGAVLSWCSRRADPSRRDWIDAMHGELPEISGGLSRLMWALGGLSLVLRTRRRAMSRPWYSWRALLKTSSFGLALSAVLVVGIVWSNVIVPSHESDDEYTAWYVVFYAALPVYFTLAGAIAGGGRDPVVSGLIAGVTTALLFAVIVMVTFIAIDNIFLSVVMQQPDKASAFARSGLTSQRDFVNQGNLQGPAIVLPTMGGLGAVCGALGGVVRRRIVGGTVTPKAPLSM